MAATAMSLARNAVALFCEQSKPTQRWPIAGLKQVDGNIGIEEKVFLHFAIALPLICLLLLKFNCVCDTATYMAIGTGCHLTVSACP